MTGPRSAAVEPRPVLICEGCRYAWEPAAPEWTADHLQALSHGCPECGGWLFLGEIASTTTRSAST